MTEPDAWIAEFDGLDRLSPEDRDGLARDARPVRLPAGARVFEPGSPCGAYVLVRDGSIRVAMTADTGREILLYRVRPGESCVLTTSCLLGDEAYAAEGTTETDVEGILLPAASFRALLARSEPFRDFVFRGFGRRVSDILATMEEAVFHRLDARLAKLVLDRGAGGPIHATHQELADELGSAREVVSRNLKTFERDGLVELARGEIRVRDRAGLGRLAARAS